MIQRSSYCHHYFGSIWATWC